MFQEMVFQLFPGKFLDILLSSKNWKAERMAFWDEIISDWNITDPQGKAIPLTAENKYLLIKGSMEFLRFANRCLEILSGAMVENKEASEKN